MMSNNQNANGILLHSKKEIEWKSFQIHSSEIAFSYIIFFRVIRGILNKKAKLSIKVIGKMRACNTFVIFHDCINLRKYLRMEYNP